jgi:hypothetical protein
MLEDKSESWDRFEQFFGWKFATVRERECQEKILHWSWSNTQSHPILEEGSWLDMLRVSTDVVPKADCPV